VFSWCCSVRSGFWLEGTQADEHRGSTNRSLSRRATTLLLVAGLGLAHGAQFDDRLLGDWGGVRTRLAAHGLDLELSYTNDHYSVNITPAIVVRPNIQFIHAPGGVNEHADVLVFGMHLGVQF
jgi:carbohydrate-selective porin OprB